MNRRMLRSFLSQWAPKDIKEIRDDFKLSQKALANLLGVTENYVYLLERGVQKPSKTISLFLSCLNEKLSKEEVAMDRIMAALNDEKIIKKLNTFINTNKRRGRYATRTQSTVIIENEFIVSYINGPSKKWSLPSQRDKIGIEKVTYEAMHFAENNGATDGQIKAVRKALTNAKYFIRK